MQRHLSFLPLFLCNNARWYFFFSVNCAFLKGVDRLKGALRKCVRIRRRKDLNKSPLNNGNGIIETSPDNTASAADDVVNPTSSETTSNNGVVSRKWSVASVAQIHPQALTQHQPCGGLRGVVRLKRHANRIRQADQTPALDPADIQRVKVSTPKIQACFFDTCTCSKLPTKNSRNCQMKNCWVLENFHAILSWLYSYL